MGEESDEETISDLSNPDVTTKYRTAGEIAQRVLVKVMELCVPEADIGTLCALGDKMLEEETGKLYNKKVKGKAIEKGIAFPTCISVNDMVAHYCPAKGERALKAGDMAKIELACHFDGFIAASGHTIIVGGEVVEDRRADAVMAAWNCAEAALRMVQVGNTNAQVTDAFEKIAADFECKPVHGVLSHQVKKHVIDGAQCIASVNNPQDKIEEFKFEMNEVYCIDISISTGEGKPKEAEIKSSVFKRNVENRHSLSTAKSRQFIAEVNRRFPALPFSIHAIEDTKVALIGVSEARRHELIEEYPVLRDKEGTFVANLKFMLLLLPGGTKKITGLPITGKEVTSGKAVQDEEMKKLITSAANPTQAKKKKKKKTSDKDGEKEGEKEDEKQED